jgi:hypothetical protein
MTLLNPFFNAVEIIKAVPDRRSRILEVVIVRRLVTWVLGIWRGEGLGGGGQFTSNLRPR